jgi:hypothetical protein
VLTRKFTEHIVSPLFDFLLEQVAAEGSVLFILGGHQRHFLHALREFEHFYNEHRTLRAAARLHSLPDPIADPEQIAQLDVRRWTGSAAPSTSTGMPPDQHG